MIRLCTWLIERTVDPDLSAQIVGDLAEQRGRGSLWLCRETVSALWKLRAKRQPGDGLVTTDDVE